MPALSIGEATSVLSAAVVIVTFFIGRVSVSKTSSAKEQRTEDKLDSLCGDTSEIKDGVKEINRKLDILIVTSSASPAVATGSKRRG